LLRDELGDAANLDQLVPYLKDRYGPGVAAGSVNLHSNRDLGATIASGSHGCSGMAIVPCSMKTLAAVAHGLSRNLIERAADVMLKERRPLIIVPRETPMSLPQLRNMVLCAEAGALVMPAMPAFYQMPQTLDHLADFMAGKILSALGFRHELYPAWKG
jgi:4-hydroxy-3-polyprenylbenzoate decarboxylase